MPIRAENPFIVRLSHFRRQREMVTREMTRLGEQGALLRPRLNYLNEQIRLAQRELTCAAESAETERRRVFGNSVRIAGIQPAAPFIMPSDNFREEIASQIAAVLPHSQEDQILENQNKACNLLMTKVASPHGRLVGMELEVTGMDSAHLLEIKNLSSRDWKVVHDGSIPYWENKCKCPVVRKCSWCNLEKEQCTCCSSAIVTCHNRDCRYQCYVSNLLYSFHNRCPNCNQGIPLNQTIECSVCLESGRSCNFNHHSRVVRCNHPEGWYGAELVSPPGKTEDFFQKAAEIMDGIKAKAEENGSDYRHRSGDRATGFHVHVDARELTKEQSALVVAYFMHNLEDYKAQFPTILPKWRTNNFYYCKTNKVHGKWTLMDLYNNTVNDRYKMVNLDSLNKHNTIEFRVGYMPGSSEEMVRWTKTLRELVEKVYTIDAEALKGLSVEDALDILTVTKAPEWQESLGENRIMDALFKFLNRSTVAI